MKYALTIKTNGHSDYLMYCTHKKKFMNRRWFTSVAMSEEAALDKFRHYYNDGGYPLSNISHRTYGEYRFVFIMKSRFGFKWTVDHAMTRKAKAHKAIEIFKRAKMI